MATQIPITAVPMHPAVEEVLTRMDLSDESRNDLRQALFDVAEADKGLAVWLLDAIGLLLIRKGEMPPMLPGSSGATLLARDPQVKAQHFHRAGESIYDE